jgi:hypothetical protein
MQQPRPGFARSLAADLGCWTDLSRTEGYRTMTNQERLLDAAVDVARNLLAFSAYGKSEPKALAALKRRQLIPWVDMYFHQR